MIRHREAFFFAVIIAALLPTPAMSASIFSGNSSPLCLIPVKNGEPTKGDVYQSFRLTSKVVTVSGLGRPIIFPLNRGGVWTIDAAGAFVPFGGDFPNHYQDEYATDTSTGDVVGVSWKLGVFRLRPGETQFERLYAVDGKPFVHPVSAAYVARLGGTVISDNSGLYLLRPSGQVEQLYWDPKLLTYAEKLQYEGYLRRQETNEAIRELSKKGTSIRQIVRQTGHSRKIVRDVLRGQRLDVFRTRPSSLDSWLPWLNSRWDDGARNALALWREMKAKGFPGQSGVVSQWAQRRRLAEKANQSGLARTPSARVIARLMTTARDDLAKSEAILVAAIEVNVPELIVARTTIGDFQSMIRSKTARKLDEWLEAAKNSLVGSFAGGVEKDLNAVRNAIISPWSNGQTEGQITRLKLIKRQMYGRAKLDLLQARLIGAS